MAHDSPIVRAKENLNLSYGGPSQRQASRTNLNSVYHMTLILFLNCVFDTKTLAILYIFIVFIRSIYRRHFRTLPAMY